MEFGSAALSAIMLLPSGIPYPIFYFVIMFKIFLRIPTFTDNLTKSMCRLLRGLTIFGKTHMQVVGAVVSTHVNKKLTYFIKVLTMIWWCTDRVWGSSPTQATGAQKLNGFFNAVAGECKRIIRTIFWITLKQNPSQIDVHDITALFWRWVDEVLWLILISTSLIKNISPYIS